LSQKLPFKDAKQRAGRFCALRERSPNEVYKKTLMWGLSESDAEKLVAELVEEGFVNEQRFANAYCHDKFEFNSWGRLKIRSHIFIHNLPDKVIEAALMNINEEKYLERLKSLAKNKWCRIKDKEPFKKKQKTANYLAGKGFELDLIWKTIDSIEGKGL